MEKEKALNILKNMIFAHFKNKNDLNVLMSLLDSVLIHYKNTSKLPDEFYSNEVSAQKRESDETHYQTNQKMMKAEEIATTSSFSTVHYIETSEVRTSNSENNSNSDLINSLIQKIKATNANDPSSILSIKDAWSLISNLTVNEKDCSVLLNEHDGLQLILEQAKLLNRNVHIKIYIDLLVILGNISEFKLFRGLLFKKELVFLFRSLLADENETVSYLASRCLINIILGTYVVSAGEWITNQMYEVNDYFKVTDEIQNLIMKLDPHKKLDFNINKLLVNSIPTLLSTDNYVCMLWANWTLKYLSHNEPIKYTEFQKIYE